MSDQRAPTEAELRTMMFQTLEQIYLHTEANTKTLGELWARIAGVEAGSTAVAEIVDENENDAQAARIVSAQKEMVSHLFEKSHQYVTVIIAGAFAAYFATLSIVAPRLKDGQLALSALLMTISLTVFALWEVFNIFYIGHHTFKGDYGVITTQPRWAQRAWYVVIVVTLVTAIPGIGISLSAYARGLDWAAIKALFE